MQPDTAHLIAPSTPVSAEAIAKSAATDLAGIASTPVSAEAILYQR